ncbi:MAG: TolC family protein [Deltaproteobacteria bacterium]|nr:TolC family protein [Deltaproteobacteria bacterium]
MITHTPRHRSPLVALAIAAVVLLLAVLPAAGEVAAGSSGEGQDGVPPRSLGRELGPFQPLAEPPSAAQPAPEEPTGPLALRAALALALAHNPELAAFSWRVRASEARVLQAGLRPNPEAALTAEDIGGSRSFRGVDQAQTTLELNQLIELGGKRAARLRAAALSRDVAAWDYEVKRLDVFTETAQAFVEVVGAQQQLELASQAVGLGEQVVQTAATRVTAGSASPVEVTKAKVALASAEIERSQARQRLEVARQRLAAQWGGTAPRFAAAEGALEVVHPVPPLEDLRQRLAQTPDLARWASELAQRQATVTLEESKAVPNVTAGAGYRRLSGPDDNALVFRLSVPVPLLNRNQGAILEARRQLAEAGEGRRAAEVGVTAALVTAYQALATAHDQVAALGAQVLPSAQGAFDILTAGYREGRFRYLDVLDAQRTLIAARVQRVRALVDYHTALAAVERLIGEPMQVEDGPDQRERD